jgi:hypothetical protein
MIAKNCIHLEILGFLSPYITGLQIHQSSSFRQSKIILSSFLYFRRVSGLPWRDRPRLLKHRCGQDVLSWEDTRTGRQDRQAFGLGGDN